MQMLVFGSVIVAWIEYFHVEFLHDDCLLLWRVALITLYVTGQTHVPEQTYETRLCDGVSACKGSRNRRREFLKITSMLDIPSTHWPCESADVSGGCFLVFVFVCV